MTERFVPGKSRAKALSVFLVLLIGCVAANDAIRSDFTDFNSIMQYNQSQQMLLNLVRMHFRESPMFLQAGSLTASYESSTEANASANFPGPTTADIGFDYKFSTKPTVSYLPIEGSSYVHQFLAEISQETFELLVRSGWPISELIDLLVERVTTEHGEILVNRRSSASFSGFEAFTTQLRQAQQLERLTLEPSKDGIRLQAGDRSIPLRSLQFRSLLDVMFEASKNTQTPESQIERVKKGEAHGEMDIRVSQSPRSDATVSVKYAGYFYSIGQNDIRSKDTLALLMQLYRIQAVPSGGAPLLTIPAR